MTKRSVLKALLKCIPDKIYIQLQYHRNTGRWVHFNNPKRYNEKLQWIKLYDRKAVYTALADKVQVKQIVTKMLGEQYVIPILAVWDSAKDIDVSLLPDQFVLKTNHDSKGVMICRNKKNFDLDCARRFFDERLRKSGYEYGREWPYKNIPRKVFAESYIEDESGGLMDYKVMCFNGQPKLIQFHQGRNTDHYYQNFYDTNWNMKSIVTKRHYMVWITAMQTGLQKRLNVQRAI